MESAYKKGKYKVQAQTNASYHDNHLPFYASCSVVDKKRTDDYSIYSWLVAALKEVAW